MKDVKILQLELELWSRLGIPTVGIVTAASAKIKRSPKKIKLKKGLQPKFISIQFMDVSARNFLKKLGFDSFWCFSLKI